MLNFPLEIFFPYNVSRSRQRSSTVLGGTAAPKNELGLVKISNRVHQSGWYLRGRGYLRNEEVMRRGQEIQREYCRCPGNDVAPHSARTPPNSSHRLFFQGARICHIFLAIIAKPLHLPFSNATSGLALSAP